MILCYFFAKINLFMQFWPPITIPGGLKIFPQLRHCNGFEENVVYINIGCREQGTRLIVLLCFYLAATKLEPRYGVATAVGEVCIYLITILLTWIRLIIIQRKQRRDCGMRMHVLKNNGTSLVTSRHREPEAANLVWQG